MTNQADILLFVFPVLRKFVRILSLPSADRVVSRYDLKRTRQVTCDSTFRPSSLLPRAFSR